MTQKIAVINQKGGVGKTTTSINLASGLAQAGHKVLLIDLDPQANTTKGAGFSPNDFEVGIDKILDEKIELHKAILPSKVVKNLYIVPSRLKLDRVEITLSPNWDRHLYLERLLENIDFDFVVMDCRPTLGVLTANAIYTSNLMVVPCEVAPFSLDGFADLMDTIEIMETLDRSKKRLLKIIINKYESRNKVTNDWIFNELKAYEQYLFKTKIRKNEALNQAHGAQESIFTFKPKSSGAEDYMQLTNEILNLCPLSEIN